nr:MAG TPA: hypothetical protein [Caudoviricetes sp.]
MVVGENKKSRPRWCNSEDGGGESRWSLKPLESC